jgi:GNAT superfamily N-acetyltransferase
MKRQEQACEIRRAVPADAEQLVQLVLGLMRHLGDPEDGFDAARFTGDAFGAEPQFSVLVAEQDRRLVGYALFHDAYEPVFAARGIYLSDIYVAAGARRHGIGRALLSAVARDGATRRRTFVWWVARGDDARMFYRTLANVEQPVTAHAVTFEAFERLLED